MSISESYIAAGLIQELPGHGLLCVLCGYTIGYFSHMKRHIEGKHSCTDGYKCPMCGAMFKTANARQIHVSGVHQLVLTSVDIDAMEQRDGYIGHGAL
jgi:hypothetical protein